MSLKFYFYPLSQPSRAVLSFLLLNDIPHEQVIVDLKKGEHKSAEFTAVNPAQVVPVIDDDGFILPESEAIVRYLLNTRDCKSNFYPKEPKVRALIDKFFPFYHSAMYRSTGRYFKASYPQIFPYITHTLEEATVELEEMLKNLDAHYIKNHKYIAGGDEITIADLFAINSLSQISFLTEYDLSRYPNVKEYLERGLKNQVLTEIQKPLKGFYEFMKQQVKTKQH